MTQYGMKVRAEACPQGVSAGKRFVAERDITRDLPADVIGGCVAEAIHGAWTAGANPIVPGFIVLVSFGAKLEED